MRPYECVSVWGVGPKSISFLKWTMFRGFGDLEFWNIPISIFSPFWTPVEAVWCCANNGQLDNSLDIYALTYYLNHHHGEFCLATLCLCYCYQVFSMYFPKSPRKAPHILELCPDLFQVAQEVIVDRPGSRRKLKPLRCNSGQAMKNAFPARRRSMVVRMWTMPTTTSDDGQIFGKVSGGYSYIGPTFLTLSERRMAQLALV